MKVNLKYVFKDLNGDPMTLKQKKDEKSVDVPMELGDICMKSLMMIDPGEIVDPGEKYERATIGEKIWKKGEVELEPEEIDLLKRLIGEKGSPVVVKQSWDILDPKVVS